MRPLDRKAPTQLRDSHAEDIRQRLRDLPDELVPPMDWMEFRSREKARPFTARSVVKWEHAAAAAGVTVLIAVMAMWVRTDHGEQPAVASTPVPEQSHPVRHSQAEILARAQASRRWLESQPAEPAVARMGSRLAVANLEDRIAWVDDVLTDAQLNPASDMRVAALQRERAQLVSSLAQVRYAETIAGLAP